MWWIEFFECDRGHALWEIEEEVTGFLEYLYCRALKDIYLALVDHENVYPKMRCHHINVPAVIYRKITWEGWMAELHYGVVE